MVDKVYFKEIETPLLGSMQNELVTYFDLSDRLKRLPVHIEPLDLLSKCPSLSAFLSGEGLTSTIRLIRTVTVKANSFYSAHLDGSRDDDISRTVALNIPMLNCAWSRTRFFEKKHPGVMPIPRSNSKLNFSYQDFSYDDLILKDEFILRCPTFLNIAEIHDVVNESNKTRYAITIRFAPEPNIFV